MTIFKGSKLFISKLEGKYTIYKRAKISRNFPFVIKEFVQLNTTILKYINIYKCIYDYTPYKFSSAFPNLSREKISN